MRLAGHFGLYAISALTAASLIAAAYAAPPGTWAVTPNAAPVVPVSSVIGTKAQLPDVAQLGSGNGILACDASNTTCAVKGMPLLSQGDPQLDAAIDSFVAPKAAANLLPKLKPDGSPELGANGAPLFYSTAEYRGLIKGYGCYDTSIVSVIHAALANRGPNAPALINRTLQFATLANYATAFGLDLEHRQLVWQYNNAFLGQNSFVDPTRAPPVVPQSMYFHEVVADLGGGEIEENCNPYVYGSCSTATAKNGWAKAFRTFWSPGTTLTNDTVIGLMRSRFVTMIAYNRFEPVVTMVNGQKKVTFKNNGWFHKVVFAGFQPGPYPLLVYDVGGGAPVRARLSSNLGELNFAAPRVSVSSGSVLPGLLKAGPFPGTFDPGFQGRPFLIYENDDKATNPLVFFLDHYDGLRIGQAPNLSVRTPLLKSRVLLPRVSAPKGN